MSQCLYTAVFDLTIDQNVNSPSVSPYVAFEISGENLSVHQHIDQRTDDFLCSHHMWA